ncbi:MAG: DUF1566 domain-containing protein [Lachnospiraceae bacterium]|nr:DUF1566 domain-containing protein [Lachnospiraceae bacterium]
MKKAVILVLSGFLMFSMAACSNTEIPSGSSDAPSLSSETDFVEPADSMAENGNDIISVQYEIGDIILLDGSIVKEADLTIVDSSNVPIAVIAGFKEDGTAFGVGVHRSDEPLQWASDDSAGYAANFTDTVCTQESDFGFLGDTDGEDNWKAICDQESEDTADAEVNYPAFHFVNTYASNYGLSGEMTSGWYMPSIAELCKIYQNRETVNNSLQHIYRLDEQAAMNGLETNWYWSASQAGSEDDYAWFVHYFNGYAGECPKNFTNVHALAVRAF